MKKSIGVIAEYNPFHNGHLLHLTEARRLAGGDLPVIAVMSGSVVQRGEPAFCNKWARAQMAVQNGADLVLELPAVFSCRSAEFFAAGAVQLLAATGITGYLAFGAETAETQTLAAAAHFINTHQEELRAIIKSSASYAAAQSTLLQNAGFTFAAAEANDILALEYCRCLQKYAPQIAPLVIRRCGAGYNSSDISAEYASASGIRTEYAAAGLSARPGKALGRRQADAQAGKAAGACVHTEQVDVCTGQAAQLQAVIHQRHQSLAVGHAAVQIHLVQQAIILQKSHTSRFARCIHS